MNYDNWKQDCKEVEEEENLSEIGEWFVNKEILIEKLLEKINSEIEDLEGNVTPSQTFRKSKIDELKLLKSQLQTLKKMQFNISSLM